MSGNRPPGLQFRLLRPEDSLTELTSLLHRAYSGLAEMGFRYLASHQSEEVTAERVATGECVVGVLDGRLVATITLVPAGVLNGTPWYERPDVAVIKQLAVEPVLQSRGIGSSLMDRMERRAAEWGAAEVAVDTAEGAEHLIRWYEQRGYRHVGYADFRPTTNYRSVVLSLALRSTTDREGRVS